MIEADLDIKHVGKLGKLTKAGKNSTRGSYKRK